MVEHRVKHPKYPPLHTGTYGGLLLGDVIAVLEVEAAIDPDRLIPGFADPHSNRGDYRNLGVSFALQDQPVSQVLDFFQQIVGQTFVGWKGGDYQMDTDVEVHLSTPGNVGEPLTRIALRGLLGRLGRL